MFPRRETAPAAGQGRASSAAAGARTGPFRGDYPILLVDSEDPGAPGPFRGNRLVAAGPAGAGRRATRAPAHAFSGTSAMSP